MSDNTSCPCVTKPKVNWKSRPQTSYKNIRNKHWPLNNIHPHNRTLWKFQQITCRKFLSWSVADLVFIVQTSMISRSRAVFTLFPGLMEAFMCLPVSVPVSVPVPCQLSQPHFLLQQGPCLLAYTIQRKCRQSHSHLTTVPTTPDTTVAYLGQNCMFRHWEKLYMIKILLCPFVLGSTRVAKCQIFHTEQNQPWPLKHS